ncbi:MAG: hydantoinase B/oxoprolinase family protein, partial [Candidatus Thorarchaeota archaeon]|nr:hydantoinase B/oxoprolinase family protein [Candidatus Thorarchaeota archaeon]
VREIELLADGCTLAIQSERRTLAPWGLSGGHPGACGVNVLRIADVDYRLQAKSSVLLPRGAIVRIETPGGGGWGAPDDLLSETHSRP